MGLLGGGPDGQRVVPGLVDGQHSPGFHGCGGQALDLEALLYAVCGPSEGRLDVAALLDDPQPHVRAQVGMHEGSVVFEAFDGVHERVHRLVVHSHQLRGVPGHVPVGGNHDRHGLAHIADPVPGHDRLLHGPHLGHRPLTVHAAGGHVTQDAPDVLSGQHRHHAWGAYGRRGVNGYDSGAGVGTPDGVSVEGIGDTDVVHERALALQ